MTFGFGLHISADHVVRAVDKRQRLETHFKRVNPAMVNIYATSEVDQTLAWLEGLHAAHPATRWVLRLMPDDGQDARPAEEVYARHKPIFERLPWVTILSGNETGFEDEAKFRAYCQNVAKLLEIAGENGHRYAYLRSAMGNPNEAYYRHYRAVFEVNARFDGGRHHLYSPNEYFKNIYPTGESGLLGRYKRAWDVAREAGLPVPATGIGEYGMALEADPQRSWRSKGSGIAGEDEYIREHAGPKYRLHYAPVGVPVSIFVYPPGVSPWGESAIGVVGLEAIEALARHHPDPPPVEITPEVPDRNAVLMGLVNRSVNDTDWTSATVQKVGHLNANVRLKPTVASQVVGKLLEPRPYQVHIIPPAQLTADEKIVSHEGERVWMQIKLWDNAVGWVRDDAATVRIGAEPEPEVPEEEAPPVVEDVTLTRAQVEQMIELALQRQRLAELIEQGYRMMVLAAAAEANVYRGMIGEAQEM